MKELRFTLPVIPPRTTAQQKGVLVVNGKPRFFTKQRVKNDESMLTALLIPFRPLTPIEGPLQVNLEYHHPYRASERKAVVVAGVPIPHDRRPDLDNTAKAMLDCMTRLQFWRDDGQIAWLSLRKTWSARPRIDVYIFAMSEQQPEQPRGGEVA